MNIHASYISRQSFLSCTRNGTALGITEAQIADVETDEELNVAEEKDAWKARVVVRIKRDREDLDAIVKEKEDVKRVRNMSEEERREWERNNPKLIGVQKQKRMFMQKYYHTYAFFQDDSYEIINRDYSAQTGDDKMILPKYMQVKHFVCTGRTKWTRLLVHK
ncbi:microfibrillar-associated protein 1-like protein [Tanacetum coccineum]